MKTLVFSGCDISIREYTSGRDLVLQTVWSFSFQKQVVPQPFLQNDKGEGSQWYGTVINYVNAS